MKQFQSSVKEKDKNGKITEEKSTSDQVLEKYKVVVLVNGGSASAAEGTHEIRHMRSATCDPSHEIRLIAYFEGTHEIRHIRSVT